MIESSDDFVQSKDVDCPWCGSSFELVVDTWGGNQEYIEDCEVCCRPIVIKVTIDREGYAWVDLKREND